MPVVPKMPKMQEKKKLFRPNPEFGHLGGRSHADNAGHAGQDS